MDRRVFLRDIDDWELYARGLEAHIGGWQEELQAFLEAWGILGDTLVGKSIEESIPVQRVYRDIERVIKEAADRAARLREADGLTEHHLYPDKT